LITEAIRMPTVVHSWKRMLKAPRKLGGAISARRAWVKARASCREATHCEALYMHISLDCEQGYWSREALDLTRDVQGHGLQQQHASRMSG
jgi:hypothetical protein